MKKRKIILIIVIILLGYWLMSSIKDLYRLMNKYPDEFKQKEGFSLIRFYNTYQTLAYSDLMIQKGRLNHEYCLPTGFKDVAEKERFSKLIEEDYQERRGQHPGWPTSLGNIDSFVLAGPNCLTEAKPISFEFKCKEAYVTYACKSGDYVREFTYTANGGGKCFYIGYKNSWGIEPKRTVVEAKKFIMGGVSDSILDSPECEPTNY